MSKTQNKSAFNQAQAELYAQIVELSAQYIINEERAKGNTSEFSALDDEKNRVMGKEFSFSRKLCYDIGDRFQTFYGEIIIDDGIDI